MDSEIDWSDNQKMCIRAFICIFASFSMIGSSMIVFSYLRWKAVRTTARLLLVFLSIADFAIAGSSLLGTFYSNREQVCLIQGFITTYASIASFLWTDCIAIYLYLSLRNSLSGHHPSTNTWIVTFSSISWIIPAIVVGFALYFQDIGMNPMAANNLSWCWIKRTSNRNADFETSDELKDQFYQELLYGKGIEIFSYFLTGWVYLLIKRKNRQVFKSDSSSSMYFTNLTSMVASNADPKLTLIPLLFVFVRIFGTVRFLAPHIFNSAAIGNNFWLALLQSVGDCSQGFVDFILYCIITKKLRRKFSLCCCYCCGLLKHSNEYSSDDDYLINNR